MKYRLILLAILVNFLAACTKELETSPTDAVPETEIYKNTANINTVINGTWRYLNDTYFTFANPGYSAIMRSSDAMGNDVAVTTKYGYRDAYAFTELYNAAGYRPQSFWTLLYKVIDNANNVLAKVDAAEGTQESKDILKGKAKGLRAFAYLNLASYYQFSYLKDKAALSVPIYTEPTTLQTVGKPRAPLSELYALIIQDLKDAAVLLKNYTGAEKYQVTPAVVHGLLARTYLNTGDWLLAAQEAKAARAGYTLMNAAQYQEGFNDASNSEWIWGHLQTPEQSTASYTFHYLDVSSSGSYYYSYMADPFFKDLFEPADARFKLFEWDGREGRKGFLKYQKFRFKSNLIGDIVYMRAAEMYLIEAEGYARANEESLAIEALNTLRMARNASAFNSGTTEQLIQQILVERRKELWGEGFALSDILRTQAKVERRAYVGADGLPLQVEITNDEGEKESVDGQGHRVVKFPDGTNFVENSPYYLFAIPQTEVRQNPNL